MEETQEEAYIQLCYEIYELDKDLLTEIEMVETVIVMDSVIASIKSYLGISVN